MKKTFYLLLIVLFLVSCGGKKAWETAQEKNTLEAYQFYVSENPKAKHIEEAELLISEIEQTMAEDSIAWEFASEEDTEIAYKEYLKQYSFM